MTEFLEEVIEALTMDEEVRTFGEVMVPVFDILLGRIKDLDLCQILLYTYLDVLLYFTKQKDIAKVGASTRARAPRRLCPQEGCEAQAAEAKCRSTARQHPHAHSDSSPAFRRPVPNPSGWGSFTRV